MSKDSRCPDVLATCNGCKFTASEVEFLLVEMGPDEQELACPECYSHDVHDADLQPGDLGEPFASIVSEIDKLEVEIKAHDDTDTNKTWFLLYWIRKVCEQHMRES